MTNRYGVVQRRACEGSGEAWTWSRVRPDALRWLLKRRSGPHGVVAGWISGRQSELSEETCPTFERRAGVRTLIVLQREVPRDAREAKPRLGKGGRKVDAGKT
jgi:hypothetical protein